MASIGEALAYGWQLHQSGKTREAEGIYRQVLGVQPTDANAWCYLGIALHDQQRFADAAAAYRRALSLQPAFPVAYNNLANTLIACGRFEEAVTSCQEALRLKPDYANACNSLGSAYYRLGDAASAITSLRQALRLRPDHAEAWNNLGASQLALRQFEHAEASFGRAIDLRPDYAEARNNRAMLWLSQGDFMRGWPEYRWRCRCPEFVMPRYQQPLWSGEPLNGRTILLHAEQGLGDAIQFVRYAAQVRARGGRAVIRCQAALRRILATCAGIEAVATLDEPLPPFDVYAPLMDLPGIFQTDLTSIPAAVPYLLASRSGGDAWQADGASQSRRIGIVWAGNPKFRGDRQRSIPLATFARLGDIPGVQLVSFQKGPAAEQAQAWGTRIIDETDRFIDFHDTAAAMQQVDLMISIDTSVAHLAGAIGKAVWLVLPFSADWRWLQNRDDSPWYPTMRLFRQSRPGDWDSVFADVESALRASTRARGDAPP